MFQAWEFFPHYNLDQFIVRKLTNNTEEQKKKVFFASGRKICDSDSIISPGFKYGIGFPITKGPEKQAFIISKI